MDFTYKLLFLLALLFLPLSSIREVSDSFQQIELTPTSSD